MTAIRVAVYGVGQMGAITARLLLDRDCEIVTAIARSDEKVGRDLGEVAGLGTTTGVIVERDAAAALARTRPDIAIVAVSSYLEDHGAQLEVCAKTGTNAITLSEEALYPWVTSPETAERLHQVAVQTGATITGSGFQDVFWVNLVQVMMGASHRVDRVLGQSQWNTDDFGPEIARDQRIGDTPDEFEAFLAAADRPPSFGLNALHAIIARLGLTIINSERESRAVLADDTVMCAALGRRIDPGKVIGVSDIDRIRTEEGTEFVMEMTGRIYRPGDSDINDWSVVGEPDLRVVNPEVPSALATCTQLINRIPDVINAAPGFTTVDRLPTPSYRPHPLESYIALP